MNFFKHSKKKTNWKYILIVVILAVLVGGVLFWQFYLKEKAVSPDGEKKALFDPQSKLKAKKLTSHGAIRPEFPCSFKEAKCFYEAVDEKGMYHFTLFKIYSINFEGEKQFLAGPEAGNPVLSPNHSLIAYEYYGPRTEDLKTNVWIMDINGQNKRALTEDGRSLVEKWLSDKEILVWEAIPSEMDGAWQAGERSRKINIETDEDIDFVFKEEKPEEKVKLEVSDEDEGYRVIRVIYEGKQIHTTSVLHYPPGPMAWEPAILEISEGIILIISSELSTGKFNLVKLDAEKEASKIIHKEVDVFSPLSLSPNKEIFMFIDANHEWWFMDKDLKKKKKLITTPSIDLASVAGELIKNNRCEVSYYGSPIWSPDSKFFIITARYYCSGARGVPLDEMIIYKIDLP